MTDSSEYTTIKEGKAEILFPKTNNVFYNPVQEFNRDLTIAVITEFIKNYLKPKGIDAVEFCQDDKNVVNIDDNENQKNIAYPGIKTESGVSILEALSATGLRSVRFAKELPGVKRIVANDLSNDAFLSIQRNVLHNVVENIVTPNVADATIYMHQNRDKDSAFDIIDLDPYGSASAFLDAAVQATKHGGLLCVTCTDMAILAGNFPEAAWAKYQSVPLKTKACHEQALRIVLGALSSHAARYSRYIEPLLSVSVDFYVRIFVRVHYGASKVKSAASKQICVYRCGGCSSFHCQHMLNVRESGNNKVFYPGVGPAVDRKCSECNHNHKIGGPFWGACLYDRSFVTQLLSSVKAFPNRFNTSERIIGMLTMIDEELHDVPFYYVTDELSQVLRCSCPPTRVIRSAILNAGHKVSCFHGKTNAVKTDAPPSVIWDIMRKWGETQNIKREKLKDDSPAKAILEKAPTSSNIDLTLRPDGELPRSFKTITRFPEMPANWGPKSKAKIAKDGSVEVSDSLKEKSKYYQGKRKRKQQTVANDIKKVAAS
ncbi:unnamed protein product [Clavelina lepadiformis]|uniref:tRNA (guanine(26)-N(2))-dimethyltransferase n=1 Tax=Clavelina lepadiformis TaxID=159417 RepID=A0ABP0G4D2_CLALP